MRIKWKKSSFNWRSHTAASCNKKIRFVFMHVDWIQLLTKCIYRKLLQRKNWLLLTHLLQTPPTAEPKSGDYLDYPTSYKYLHRVNSSVHPNVVFMMKELPSIFSDSAGEQTVRTTSNRTNSGTETTYLCLQILWSWWKTHCPLCRFNQ